MKFESDSTNEKLYDTLVLFSAVLLAMLVGLRVQSCFESDFVRTFDSYYYLYRLSRVSEASSIHLSNDWFFSLFFGTLLRISSVKAEVFYRNLFLFHYLASLVALLIIARRSNRWLTTLLILGAYVGSDIFFVGSNIHIRQFVGMVWVIWGMIIARGKFSSTSVPLCGVLAGIMMTAGGFMHFTSAFLAIAWVPFISSNSGIRGVQMGMFAVPFLAISAYCLFGPSFHFWSIPSLPLVSRNYFLSVLPTTSEVELLIERVLAISLFAVSIASKNRFGVFLSVVCLIFFFPPFASSSDVAARFIWFSPSLLMFAFAFTMIAIQGYTRFIVELLFFSLAVLPFVRNEDLEYTSNFPYSRIERYSSVISEWLPRNAQVICPHGACLFLTYLFGVDASSMLSREGTRRQLVLLSRDNDDYSNCIQLDSKLESIVASSCLRIDQNWYLRKK